MTAHKQILLEDLMKRNIVYSLCILLVVALAGCSDNPTENSQLPNELNLDSEFGGYTASDESFAFDDAVLMTESANDADYGDPLMGNPIMDSLMNHPRAGHFQIRIIWGQLRLDTSHTAVTDWTGSLSITNGGEVIRRLIHWDLNQDFILPRTDRKLIEWISKTSIHNDGIVVDFLLPPVPPIFDSTITQVVDSLGDTLDVIVVDTTFPEPEPIEVTFATGPYTRTFSLEELNKLDTIVTLDDSNAVAFHALRIDRRECPAGFFNGFWGYNDEGHGVFRGMWISEEGFITGFVKGHFGKNENGENVLFGKYINRNGRFQGFLKGTYESNPDDMSDSTRVTGMFSARIYNNQRMEIGALEGKYRAAENWAGGFMEGRWKFHCQEPINVNDPSYRDGIE